MKRIVLTSFTILCLLSAVFLLVLAFDVHLASAEPKRWNVDDDGPADFRTIQEAINAASPADTIFVYDGTYHENVVVNKSVSLVGENRNTTIIDGGTSGTVVLVTANRTTVRGFTMKNGNTGIYSTHSDDSLITENILTHNVDAIFARLVNNCTIRENVAGNNTHRGILITNSRNFTVSDNYVFGNGWYGINANTSTNGLITRNDVYENYYDGIGLLNSSSCEITENTIGNNQLYGVWLDSSNDIFISHNNFINNGFQQAIIVNSKSLWHDGFEGNYWSNYTGFDLNHDGIGDEEHVIDEKNRDRYPLMGIFSSFTTLSGSQVNVISNSTIEAFEYFGSNRTITMYVSGMILNQKFGFCRVSIPHVLMDVSNISVIIDNGLTPVLHHNYTLHDNTRHKWIYFAYPHSIRKIDIVPEFPSLLVPPLFMIVILITIIVYLTRRKPKTRPKTRCMHNAFRFKLKDPT